MTDGVNRPLRGFWETLLAVAIRMEVVICYMLCHHPLSPVACDGIPLGTDGLQVQMSDDHACTRRPPAADTLGYSASAIPQVARHVPTKTVQGYEVEIPGG